MEPNAINTFSQKAISSGYTAKQVQDFLRQKMETEARTALVTSGDIDYSSFAEKNPVEALNLRSQGFNPQTNAKPTADQQKKLDKENQTLQNLDVLEGFLNDSEIRGPVGGRLGFLGNLSGGAINPKSYQFNQLRNALISPLARVISGEVGTLNEGDVKRAESLLPRLEEDPEVAAEKIATLRALLNASQTSTAKGKTTDRKGFIRSIVESITDPFVKTGQTILGAGYEVGQEIAGNTASSRGLHSDNPFLSEEEINKYATDPAGQVLNQAGRSAVLAAPALAKAAPAAAGLKGALQSGAIYGGAYGAANEREGADLGGRLGDVASGAATGAAVGAAGYGVLQVAAKAGKILHPFRTVGEMKRAAVADAGGATINGDDVLVKLTDGLQNVSPTDRMAYMKFLENAKPLLQQKNIPLSQAVEIAHSANTAYSTAGKVGKSAKAAFNDVLAKSIKEQINGVAPGVGEANKLFKMLYGGEKFGKRVAGGAAGAAMTVGLIKLLGL